MNYTKDHPFIGSLKERTPLTFNDSTKDTWHLVIDLEGSELSYNVGDSLGIYSENEENLVQKTLSAFHFSGDEMIQDKRSLDFMSLKKFLTTKASITGFSRKFFNEVILRAGYDPISLDETPKEIIEKHHLWDFLSRYSHVRFSPQEAADLMMPLLPRYYSIASSPLYKKDEVHLTVAHLKYRTNEKERVGVCTHYLCQLAPLYQKVIHVFVQPSHGFVLPEDKSLPIIMIGPGTGVAPFRAFMQERELSGATGKNWLFFGERNRKNDFYYESDWRRWEDSGLLTLDLAFSRDQEEKVYVQHKLLEKGKEIVSWLEKGALIYVCGDANHMAKDVDHALHKIVELETSFNPTEYIKTLKKEKRYLRDVY